MKHSIFYKQMLLLCVIFELLFFLGWLFAAGNLIMHVVSAIGCTLSVIAAGILMYKVSREEPKYMVTGTYVRNRVLLIDIEDPNKRILAYIGEFPCLTIVSWSEIRLVKTPDGLTAFRKPAYDENRWALDVDKKLRAETSKV